MLDLSVLESHCIDFCMIFSSAKLSIMSKSLSFTSIIRKAKKLSMGEPKSYSVRSRVGYITTKFLLLAALAEIFCLKAMTLEVDECMD